MSLGIVVAAEMWNFLGRKQAGHHESTVFRGWKLPFSSDLAGIQTGVLNGNELSFLLMRFQKAALVVKPLGWAVEGLGSVPSSTVHILGDLGQATSFLPALVLAC